MLLQAFYSASALLALHAERCTSWRDSVRLSISPAVTFRCFIQTNEGTIVRFQHQVGQSF